MRIGIEKGKLRACALILISISVMWHLPAFQGVQAASYDFSVKDVYWEAPLFPENRTLVVVLTYSGSPPATSVNATLDISKVSADSQFSNSSYNGTLVRGDTLYLEFSMNLSSAAIAGSYLLPLRVDYIKGYSVHSFVAQIRADVMGVPDLEALPIDVSIIRGHLNSIDILIENKGDGVARNVMATVQGQDIYLTLVGANRFDLGSIQPGTSTMITIALFAENSISDGSSFSITLTYDGEDGTPYTRTLSIGVKVEGPDTPRLAASANTTELTAGSLNNVALSVRNLGRSSALNITVKVTPASESLTLIGANSFDLDELEPDQASMVSLPLFLDKEVYGSLRLSVSMAYRDERNATFADTVTIGFKVAEAPAPLIEVSANVSTLKPNSISGVAFELKNIGTDSARNVTVSLFSQSPQAAVIIGAGTSNAWEILPGESLVVERSIFVQPGVFGAVPIYVQVQYQDSLDNPYTYTSSFGFSVRSDPEVRVSTVNTVPSPIFPGDKVVKVICSIVNSGNYTAEDTVIEMGQIAGVVGPSYAGTDRCTIPYLQVGASVQVQFLVDVASGAAPGYYDLPLTVASPTGNRTVFIPLTIREKAPVSIESIYFDREVTPGARSVKVFVQISNNGSQTAEQLRLSIVSGYMTGSTSTLVGSLPGNSTKIVMMEVDIDPKVLPGSLPADVELSWVQDSRQLSSTAYCSLPVSAPSAISPIAYVALAIAIMVLAIAFRKRLYRLVR